MPLRFLSLFTGIGVAELALKQVFPDSICVGCSEIDRDALCIFQRHFPNHVNLGDVTKIDGKLFKGTVDLIIGGSPCQAFSKTGKKRGFQDPRAQLFHHYKRILRETEARWFIFENVNSMKREIRHYISAELNVEPVAIDASWFTPQVRRRLFWTNFPVHLPTAEQRKTILLRNIILNETKMKDLTQNTVRGVALRDLLKTRKSRRDGSPDVFAITLSGPYNAGVKARTDEKTNTVMTMLNDLQIIYDGNIFRRLDCVEAERLQGIPDNYTSMLPRVRRYKCIGNAYCLPVIIHVLECLRNHVEESRNNWNYR
jgi:site-specific DNA-cytosine methylase